MHFLHKTRRLAFLLLLGSTAAAQQREPIDRYIHQSWDALTRSTSDCASLIDPKVSTTPVLYLPAHERTPTDVRAMQSRCKVDVRHLPHTITHSGDVMPADVPTPGLLYLPNPYVVPGGRFNEMYGWDSYFILLGELADGRLSLARGTVENFFYEIEHYGAVLNANRTYFLTRSQPPFLSSMVLAIYRELARSDPAAARKWLHESWPYLVHDHALWTEPPHLAGNTGLSRYSDLGEGPVPEMNDASTYYVDAIHWMLAHPKETPAGYLEKVPPNTPPHCPANEPCLRTDADGFRLTDAFFSGDRAMRESSFDTSFRFGPFGGSTDHYAPACLNILLYKYERDLAFIAARLGDTQASTSWSSAAGVRLAHINTLLWDDHAGLFTDLDFTRHTQSTYAFLSTFYALWAGLATPTQAQRIAANLPLFERDGGLATSTHQTGAQWDAPFGWAPLEWIAIAGLERYGFHDAAFRLAQKWTATVEAGYARDNTIREKYNVETGSSDVTITAGYTQNVIGFGWTNAVYLRLQSFLAGHPIEQP